MPAAAAIAPVVAGAAGVAAATTTAATIAAGVTLASGAIGAVGQITGSKTLKKIGSIGGVVGGLGMGAAGLAGGYSASQATQTLGGAGNTVSGLTGGATPAQPVQAVGGTPDTINNMLQPARVENTFQAQPISKIGEAAANTSDVQSLMERAHSMLKRYDTAANILAGVGQGFSQYQSAQMQQQSAKERLKLEREMFEAKQRGLSATPQVAPLGQQGIRTYQGGQPAGILGR